MSDEPDVPQDSTPKEPEKPTESKEPEEFKEPPKEKEVAPSRAKPFDLRSALAGALALTAAACAAWFGWSWYQAAHDDSLNFSKSRDGVLRAAEQGVLNMNTLDYRTFDQGLDRWVNSATGDLQQQIIQGRGRFRGEVQKAKTVTTAKILDGAVVELDDRAGKASAIVAVQITVTPETGQPSTKQSRMQAQLTRTSTGWRLSALGQAPLGATGSGN